jgi:hypothetical protein
MEKAQEKVVGKLQQEAINIARSTARGAVGSDGGAAGEDTLREEGQQGYSGRGLERRGSLQEQRTELEQQVTLRADLIST